MAIEVLLPSIIKIGGGAISEASGILKRMEVRHPLIVTDALILPRVIRSANKSPSAPSSPEAMDSAYKSN